LRVLFSTALVFGCVSDPKALWERFCTNICDDLTYRIQQMGEVGIPPEIDNPHLDYGLYLLQKLLTNHGKCLSDFGMPEPIHDWDRSGGNPLLTAELAYDPLLLIRIFQISACHVRVILSKLPRLLLRDAQNLPQRHLSFWCRFLLRPRSLCLLLLGRLFRGFWLFRIFRILPVNV